MQIALAAVLVFSLVWFAVLRPKEDDVAATPVTPAETAPPRSDAGGASATSALGKTIETAKTGAANADASTKARESQTGEETTASATTPKTAPKATTNPTTPAATTPAESDAAGDEQAERTGISATQKRADKVITKIQKDLAARRAVVVLVWAKTGKEDKIVHERVTKDINRRKGKVRIYTIPVSQVGRYDGLLSGLSLGQIPSTIVIAPNNEAKVLGGLVSTERVDRLTSSATLTKPLDDGATKKATK
ncbi:MAG: hypothetical protein Q7T55_11485 [Solirubrobacteraceae bacterium]|nr:hypothetical protein [Solirubrobacteraceae bacterium]